jgi:hypothetical protein
VTVAVVSKPQPKHDPSFRTSLFGAERTVSLQPCDSCLAPLGELRLATEKV